MNVHIEKQMQASADRIWSVLAHEFAEIGHWSTIVETSRRMELSEVPESLIVAKTAPVPGRVTKTQFATLREVLTEFSDEQREFVFAAADLPPFLSKAENRSRVVETGANESTLIFDIDIELRGPFKLLGKLMERRFNRTYGEVQEELKHYVETGEVRS